MSHPTSLADGRYLLVQPLGEGGMATVYRCFDQRLQVWRAVKLLLPQYAMRPKLRSRFEAEAQTMALLEHRHIVRVYDVGTEGDMPYIVMELVEGGSLVDWLEENGPMPPLMACQVTCEVCDGIAAAHAKGVIHRDIKPHNVMVTTDRICKVTDFGIARVGDTDQSLTKTGAVMGTWGYMAPEQRTNAKGVDGRADVYAIAATLYSLLTDKMPTELFLADRDDSMMLGIPGSVVEVLMKACEYKREDRYADVLAFKEALQGAIAELPPLPADTPPLARDPGEPPPIPDPADFVVKTPQVIQGGNAKPGGAPGGDAQPTILPDAGPSYAPTVPPDEVAITEAGSMPRQDRPVYDPNATGSHTVPPAEPRASSALRWATLAVWTLGIMLFGSAALLGVAGAIYTLGSTSVDTASPEDPILEAPKPAPTPDPVKDTGKVPEVTPKPVPGPVPTTPKPAPVPVAPKPVPVPTKPVPVPVTVKPEPVPAPAAQCVNVTPPKDAEVGAKVNFAAKLCTAGKDPTLFFRPAGSKTWNQVRMPFRLGAHRAQVSVDAAYARGLEYYVAAEGASFGSSGSPKVVAIYEAGG